MTLYKIGQYEGLPMTRVVDKLLRDSIKGYISNLEDDEIAERVFYRKKGLNGNGKYKDIYDGGDDP